MRKQSTSLTREAGKSAVALCALTGGMWSYLSATIHQSSAFTARNPRNPEDTTKAALD